MIGMGNRIDSRSLWERAEVRSEATGNSMSVFLLPSALTLTLSQREREQGQ
jgi:hypothetical protein